MSSIERLREHQANERTFLAWLRTSIALIGFGLAIDRFSLFLREKQPIVGDKEIPTFSMISSQSISIGLVIAGIIIIMLAVWRYNQVFQQIEQDNYQPTRFLIWATAGIVIFMGIISISFLVVP
jgi:putative membrane protein